MHVENETRNGERYLIAPILLFVHHPIIFQMALRDARLIDDKIVYALNNSVPTASFKGLINASVKCAELHKQVRIFE
jgi:hypothetical protein